MLEIDFLPVASSTAEGSTKSGDAITGRFTDGDGRQRVIVVDGGYQATGQELVDHIRCYYETQHVDLVISTHPDADHINGLATVVEQLDVDELLIHQPRVHAIPGITSFSNIEAVDALIAVAKDNSTMITEPFTGLERFGGALQVLSPDEDFYEDLIREHLAQVTAGTKSISLSSIGLRARNLLERAVSLLPALETLTDAGETNPRNETSVVTLLDVAGHRMLLTGDAGQRALTRAADRYEAVIGEFEFSPLALFQVPHHGSRRNIGPTLLDRILGPRYAAFASVSALISAAKDAPKHPSAKVVNALKRRGARVVVTAGTPVCHSDGSGMWRAGWGPAPEVPALDEGVEPDE
ncbi:MBL fold metallo-hydrolase [Pseudonocardia sp. NPDC049154]|uniref:ComEC/Rec2 family competence protein n=1 Tax=Pseudonocardia sp. NPDC049154 TaxID=3155501 RepID=UPI0033DB2C07